MCAIVVALLCVCMKSKSVTEIVLETFIKSTKLIRTKNYNLLGMPPNFKISLSYVNVLSKVYFLMFKT